MKAWLSAFCIYFLIQGAQGNEGFCGLNEEVCENRIFLPSGSSPPAESAAIILEDTLHDLPSKPKARFFSAQTTGRIIGGAMLCGSGLLIGLLLTLKPDSSQGTYAPFCNPQIPNSCRNCTLSPRWQSAFESQTSGNIFTDMLLRHSYCVMDFAG